MAAAAGEGGHPGGGGGSDDDDQADHGVICMAEGGWQEGPKGWGQCRQRQTAMLAAPTHLRQGMPADAR
jgi:hypothetical protein